MEDMSKTHKSLATTKGKDNSNNCYQGNVPFLFFNSQIKKYKNCLSHCYSCNDDTSCNICEEGYKKANEYDENENSFCVLNCRRLVKIENLVKFLTSNEVPYTLKLSHLAFFVNVFYPTINNIVTFPIDQAFKILKNLVIPELNIFYFFSSYFIDNLLAKTSLDPAGLPDAKKNAIISLKELTIGNTEATSCCFFHGSLTLKGIAIIIIIICRLTKTRKSNCWLW